VSPSQTTSIISCAVILSASDQVQAFNDEASLFDAFGSPFLGSRNHWPPQTVPGSPFFGEEKVPERNDFFGRFYERQGSTQPTLQQLFGRKDESDVMADQSSHENRSTFLFKKTEFLKPTNRNRALAPPQSTQRPLQLSLGRQSALKGRTKHKMAQKLNKGLKQLSLVVRDIVIEKKSTTYKEVADIILRDTLELEDPGLQTQAKIRKEEQNIKRRVYDALNVLISAGVLIKEGKLVKKDNSSKLMKANQLKAQIVL
jgi:hypothetical protein